MATEEQKKQRKSLAITAVIQVVMLVVLYLILAWREPDPPIPEYGIEIGFTEEAGSSAASTQESVTQEAPEEDATQETSDEQVEVTEGAELRDEQQPDAIDVSSQEEIREQQTEDINSPDEVRDTTEDQETSEIEQPTELDQPENEVENQTSESDLKASDQSAEIDERALYNAGGEGDEGKEDGASLQMTGWKLHDIPDPKDESQESGKIVFEIRVDEDGYVVGIRTLTSTVTPAVELRYRRAVEQLILEKTEAYQPAPISIGRITFILKSR